MTLDELDGVAVAPGNHRVLFENEEVRVIDITIAAGRDHADCTPTSPRPVLYRLSGSHFIRRDEHGATLFDSRADPVLRDAGGVVQRVPAAARHREHRR